MTLYRFVVVFLLVGLIFAVTVDVIVMHHKRVVPFRDAYRLPEPLSHVREHDEPTVYDWERDGA